MILIRNRQHPLDKSKLLNSEINVGGYITEDINSDGSAIHITSGLTQSRFFQTTLKSIFTKGSGWKFPPLVGDQIVINSDRLVFSAKANEIMHFSKKRYMIVTDDEYVLDAQKQIVLNTNNKTVINSPAIYLGEYNNTNEPAVLGQSLVDWLFDICNWMLMHTHEHMHVHNPHTSPPMTKAPKDFPVDPMTIQLILLRDRLHSLLSRRVFLTGGGYAPGFNGVGTDSVQIKNTTGETSPAGIPGGWHGRTRRTDAGLSDNSVVDSITATMVTPMKSFINSNVGKMSDTELTRELEKMIDGAI
jgi:hypothetical protein